MQVRVGAARVVDTGAMTHIDAAGLYALIAKLKKGGAVDGMDADTGVTPLMQPTALLPDGSFPTGDGPGPLDLDVKHAARETFANDATAVSLMTRLFGAVPDAQTSAAHRAPPSAAREVHEALKELGYPVGDDPERVDDETTQESIKRLKENAGFEATGDVDLELMMAILESMMAKDRADSARRNAQRSTGGGGGPSSPSSSTTNGGPPGPIKSPQPTAPIDTKNWKPGQGDVTAQQLQQIVPGLSAQKAAEVAPHLNRAMKEGSIDTPQKKAAFIAQVAHESGGFKYNEEIASGRQYEGRRDLGNTQPGDGERFKGRGYIQLTGRANYTAAGKALGLDLVNNPQLAARPENAARIAAWYWSSRGLNKHADGSQAGFDQITRKINGGFNGKADRDALFRRALGAGLADGAPSTGTFVEPAKIDVGDARFGSKAQQLASIAEQTAIRMNTVGKCAKGVNTTLERMYGGDFSGHAYQKADQLARDPRFKELDVANASQLSQLPPGAIVVWGRSAQKPWGHVTVTLGGGREASDHVQRLITGGAYGTDFGRGDTGKQFRVFVPQG